eukprot:8221513-Heterocapsa_arctica.AAC.1
MQVRHQTTPRKGRPAPRAGQMNASTSKTARPAPPFMRPATAASTSNMECDHQASIWDFAGRPPMRALVPSRRSPGWVIAMNALRIA